MKFFTGKSISILLLLSFCLLASFSENELKLQWNNETTVADLLVGFGMKLPEHARPDASSELIQKGKDLVYLGKTLGPDGKSSRYISKFYACVSCHNPVKEEPNVLYFDPQERLEYAEKHNLKFLQGSTFYGIANRESWYNDDYVLKYGELVKPASASLAESIQLCAKVCSSGRYLEDWELESILAYFWNNQLIVKDLSLTNEEINKLNSDLKSTEKIDLIKSKYAQKSPATFGYTPKNQDKGYVNVLKGNPANGEKIYKLSCMSCHQEEGVSGTTFNQAKVDFQKFKRNIGVKSDYNIYDIVRKGTYAEHGKLRYMPLYTQERMSDQQLEDLRAYIELEAAK